MNIHKSATYSIIKLSSVRQLIDFWYFAVFRFCVIGGVHLNEEIAGLENCCLYSQHKSKTCLPKIKVNKNKKKVFFLRGHYPNFHLEVATICTNLSQKFVTVFV